MKYVAWANIQQQYKFYHIHQLNISQFCNFLILFFRNIKLAEFVLFKKMYMLFNWDNLDEYNENELIKLYKLCKVVSLESAIKLVVYDNITIYNTRDILLFLRDKNKFINKEVDIKWGPGNHGNPIDNVKKHYIKHILSDEGIYWNNISLCDYEKFAIDSFYKMERIIVHTNGRNVYLSGFYGNIFIVGRYDGDVFGLSSCYYVENGEKKGRYKGMCFKISL
jgi:hypothetical protein